MTANARTRGGGGGGGGSPSSDRLVTIVGFSSANKLKSADGTLGGGLVQTLGILGKYGAIQGIGASGFQTLADAGTLFTRGYALRSDALRPGARMAGGASNKLDTGGFNPSWIGGSSTVGTGAEAGSHYQLANFKHVFQVLRRDGDNLSLFVNGVLWRTIALTLPVPGYTASLTGCYLGVAADGSSNPLTGGGIAGVGYTESAAFSDAEIFQWTEDVMDALDVVDESSTGLENLYSAKAQGLADGASMPSALEDQIGSTDFSLIGSLDIRYERARWV